MEKVKKVKSVLHKISEALDEYPEADGAMGYMNDVIERLPRLTEDNAFDWIVCLLEIADVIAKNSIVTSDERGFSAAIVSIIKDVTLGVEVA